MSRKWVPLLIVVILVLFLMSRAEMFTPKQTAPEIDEGVLDLSQYEQLQNVKV